MKTFVIVLLTLMVNMAFAIPQLMSYQGQLMRTDGSPLDTTVAMTFRLYSAPSGGTTLWTESRPSVTSFGGLFNVQLGSVTALPESVLSTPQVWLGLTVGNNSEMTPRNQLVSVGYAYRVGTVDGASGGRLAVS